MMESYMIQIILNKFFFFKNFSCQTIGQTRSVIDKSVNRSEIVSGISCNEKSNHPSEECKSSNRFTLFYINELDDDDGNLYNGNYSKQILLSYRVELRDHWTNQVSN